MPFLYINLAISFKYAQMWLNRMTKYEDVVNLALRRSLFYPASEIYSSAPAGFYDFGPYGAAIRRKIIEVWRKELIQKESMLEIYGAQTMPEAVFQSSGHLKDFNDVVTECSKCNSLHRADQLIADATNEQVPEGMPPEEYTKEIKTHKLKCPKCKGALKDAKKLNLMVQAIVGFGDKQPCYLRSEACQTIFTNFARMAKTMRMKLPQGIAQVGRAFRNEISPRQTLLRQVEFSQMEAEVFFDPKHINEINGFDEVKNYKVMILKAKSKKVEAIKVSDLVSKKVVSGKLVAYYLARTQQFFEKLGLPTKAMRFREVGKDDRPFYSKETWDFEVETSVGWLELVANNYRTDYDIKGHMEGSKQDLHYVAADGTKLIPHIWEISIGVDRTFYAALEHAYTQEKRGKEQRVLLSVPPRIAPLLVAVFPLLSNKPELVKQAQAVYDDLKGCYESVFDASGSIGKRYARMDEIGCPWCITIDFDSAKNKDVTLRDRDSGEQKRVKSAELRQLIFELYAGLKKFKDL